MWCVRKRRETIWRYLWHPKYAHNSTLRLTKGISPPGVVWGKWKGWLVGWVSELSLINCVYSYAKIRIADWATFCRYNPLNLMERRFFIYKKITVGNNGFTLVQYICKKWPIYISIFRYFFVKLFKKAFFDLFQVLI